LRDVEAAVRTMRLQIEAYNPSTSPEIDAAFATLVRERPDALIVAGDGFFHNRRVQLANLTVRHALPAAFTLRQFVEAGGLMSYGANLADAWRQAGVYVGRILRGAKPAELPVLQPTKFELVINVQTATSVFLLHCICRFLAHCVGGQCPELTSAFCTTAEAHGCVASAAFVDLDSNRDSQDGPSLVAANEAVPP
jgi:ABC transporter substrate binding protein